MDKPSQFFASAKVKRSDRKGGNANRDIDHVEEKDGHWVILFGASPAMHKSTFDKMLIMTAVDCFDWSHLFVEPIDPSPETAPGDNVALRIVDCA